MVLKRSIYRTRALLRQRQAESLDDLLSVTAPHEWVMLCAFGLVLLIAAAWGVLGTIEESISAPAALLVSGQRHDVVSSVSGTVLRVSVTIGDRVEAGDTLAIVATAEGAQLARLEASLEELLPPDLSRQAIDAIGESLGYDPGSSGSRRLLSPGKGEVTTLSLAPGRAVAVGDHVAQIASGSEPGFEVLAFVPWGQSEGIRAGMEARVFVDSPLSDAADVLAASVLEVSDRPERPAPWLADLALAGASSQPTRMVRAALSYPPGDWAEDRTACLLQVPIGHRSPASLLVPDGWR